MVSDVRHAVTTKRCGTMQTSATSWTLKKAQLKPVLSLGLPQQPVKTNSACCFMVRRLRLSALENLRATLTSVTTIESDLEARKPLDVSKVQHSHQ